jgi:hypothetical protein
MDKNTGIFVGIAGVSLAAALGYFVYTGQTQSSNTAPFQSQQCRVNNTGVGLYWKSHYLAQHIAETEKVLYNAVDSLSIYAHANSDVFLDIVYYVGQYCLVYLHSQKDPHNLKWTTMSSKLQTPLTNSIVKLKEEVQQRYPVEQRTRINQDFNDRAELILSIINSYHVNMMRQTNVK